MSISRLTQLAGVVLLAVVVAAGTAKATEADPTDPGPAGMLGFNDIGIARADGSIFGNINAATTFRFGFLVSTVNRNGAFASLPTQFFGSTTFNRTIPTSLTFSTGPFGKFASTSIMEVSNVAGHADFDVVGDWTPGTFFHGLSGGPFPALFNISFDQTPAHRGLIEGSATLALVPIPEPSSIVLVLTGLLAGVGIYGLRRRRRRHLEMA